MTQPTPDRGEAERFLTLLDEEAEGFCFRCFDDNEDRKDPNLSAKLVGSLDECWPRLLDMQARGCGVYVVVNAGGQKTESITRVRAVFADFDGVPLPERFDLEPHAIVQSSPGKWHAYWLVEGLPLEAFKDIQRNIAARYGSDPVINDLPRVMRLPGFLHQKHAPYLSHLVHESGQLPFPAETIIAAFGGPSEAPAAPASAPAPNLGETVQENRHADVLKLTLLLAQAVRNQAMTRDEAFDLMRQRRDSGRWSRHVPDEEIQRALDGALAKGGPVTAPDLEAPAEPASEAIAGVLDAAAVPFTDEELAAAAIPHPHAFMSADGKRGLFPVGEVSVLAAPGREGKTTIIAAVAKAYALGQALADMAPAQVGSVMIYSAEDDRSQYARKVQAQRAKMTAADARRLQANVVVPDLHGEVLAGWREVVRLEARQPVRGAIIEPLIETIRRLQQGECPLGLVIFETASTLSDAEEDNVGLRVLVSALKHIAKVTGTAVVLTHHTSQEAARSLPTLELSETAFRGGTALVNNARQTLLAVNLGSAYDPFPDADARTLLRGMVAPGERERVTLVACLSSSKSADPCPMFFRWDDVEPYGPRAVELTVPEELAGKSWRSVYKRLLGAKSEAAADRRAEKEQASVRLVVRAVAEMCEAGEFATVAKVSAKCGHGADWAKPRLAAAVELGELVRSTEQIPRTRGLVDVYRPANSPKPWRADSSADSSAPWLTPKGGDK